VAVFRGLWPGDDLANEIDDCVAASAETLDDLEFLWLVE
jgi:hypothetical protein